MFFLSLGKDVATTNQPAAAAAAAQTTTTTRIIIKGTTAKTHNGHKMKSLTDFCTVQKRGSFHTQTPNLNPHPVLIPENLNLKLRENAAKCIE